jgi:hypothetical protein
MNSVYLDVDDVDKDIAIELLAWKVMQREGLHDETSPKSLMLGAMIHPWSFRRLDQAVVSICVT